MNKKMTMYHPIYHAIYKMWIGRSIVLGEKSIQLSSVYLYLAMDY